MLQLISVSQDKMIFLIHIHGVADPNKNGSERPIQILTNRSG
jgi:hypothetical protein